MGTVLSILVFLAIGALAGWLAGLIMKVKGGLWFNIILGVAGALVGSWLGKLLGFGAGFLTFTWQSILSAVVGACVVTFVVRLFKK